MMRPVPILLSLLAAAVLCAPGARAAQPVAPSVYKCRVDGKLSYSDRPCPGGQGETLPPAPAGIAPVGGMDGGDSRTLLELEKLRTERARQDAIANREQRAQARAGHVRVRDVERCQKRRLQQKWLEDDLAQARTPAQQAAARSKLQRQREATAVECPG